MLDPLRKLLARGLSLTITLGLTLTANATVPQAPIDWYWLVPWEGPLPAAPPDPPLVHRLPGSEVVVTDVQLRDLKHAVDWFPAEHPAMPSIVAQGHDNANACGFCHLPTGSGRPENSSLAGLPADYIKRQVAAFANGSRQSAAPIKLPVQLMSATAKAVTPGELDQAAAYFSKLPYASHVDVVETAEADFKAGLLIYLLEPGNRQPVGDRIIEAPVDHERFEQRDPHVRFVAYVPPGSIEAGRALAATGGPAGQPCASCHGEGLRGGTAPPLAGRSPTVIVRQLAAFHEGTRANPEAAPMRLIASQLSSKEMIAVAAYAASLKP